MNKIQKLTVAGITSFIIPFSLFCLWIYAFNTGDTQKERVELMHNFLPELIHNNHAKILINIVFSLFAVYFGNSAIRLSHKSLRIFNIFILVFSILLLTLNIYFLI